MHLSTLINGSVTIIGNAVHEIVYHELYNGIGKNMIAIGKFTKLSKSEVVCIHWEDFSEKLK